MSLIISSSSNSLPDGFVYVRDLIPDIQISLRYASDENFQGHIVNGYLANVSILTRAATLALKEVQTKAKSQGFELVIYDGYRPQKSVNQFVQEPFDYVVTVCDDADKNCPNFRGKVGKRMHIGFPDPAKATGSDAEKLAVFRKVRDAIRVKFRELYERELR